jgi:hypothetical protein
VDPYASAVAGITRSGSKTCLDQLLDQTYGCGLAQAKWLAQLLNPATWLLEQVRHRGPEGTRMAHYVSNRPGNSVGDCETEGPDKVVHEPIHGKILHQ